MISIPCSVRHSISCINDIQHLYKNEAENPLTNCASHRTTTKAALQYFNKRVTQRLHRYRSMKRQWQEVATSIQNISSLPSKFGSSIFLPAIESKAYSVSDYINATTAVRDNYEENSIELDPLHSRIQQDLMKLRKLIKKKQKKLNDNTPFVTLSVIRSLEDLTSIPTAFDNQESNTIKAIRKASPSNKLKPLDRVKISGCQMRSSTLPKSDSVDSGVGSTSNSSSTCSQHLKQQQQQKLKRQYNNKTFNICHSRVNPPPPPPLPSDSPIHRSSHLSKKKSNTSSKMSQNIRSKQPLASRLSLPTPPIPPIVRKKQPSFTKQETRSPLIRRLSQSVDTTTRLYTYAASSSSATPRSMMLKRNTSLLPILLQSCCCTGIQPRQSRSNKSKYDLDNEQGETNNDDNDYYYLLDYKNLLNRLPKSMISIRPHYGQDDYGILFEQVNHIRKTMPDSNIYDEYARIV